MQIMLPYGWIKDSKLVTKLKKQLNKSLPNNIKTIVTYQSKNLPLRFHVEDKNNFNFCHKINFVYHGKHPNEICRDNYIRKADCRIEERIIDHKKRDKNSQFLRYARETKHHNI